LELWPLRNILESGFLMGYILKIQKESWKMPEWLKEALMGNLEAKKQFKLLTPYKQKEYYEYISTVQLEKLNSRG
jgi:uncharacterized protein YdeI (YjbR/CyaY-like superfamily)